MGVVIDLAEVQCTAAVHEEDYDGKQVLVVVAAGVGVLVLVAKAISLFFIENYSRRRDWQALIPQYARQLNTEAFMQYNQLYWVNTVLPLLLICPL